MCLRAAPAGHEQHPPRIGLAQQRIERTDQPPVGGDIDLQHFLEGLGIHMRQRRELPQHAGIAQKRVQPAPALIDGGAQPVDGVEIAQVHRHQRRGAAELLDLVVGLFQPAHGARHQDDMGAGLGQRDGRKRGRCRARRR